MFELPDLYPLYKQYMRWFSYPPTRWYFLISCGFLALGVYWFGYAKSQGYTIKGFIKYLFPKSIYTHASTKLDLKYALSFPIIGGLLFKPALGFATATATYQYGYKGLEYIFGAQAFAMPESGWTLTAMIVLFTIVSAMAADFCLFLQHYLMHKVKFLWEFHKVHHSAEVLTPLVDYRVHPIEILTFASTKGIGIGAAQALFNYMAGAPIHIYNILGLNALLFISYIFGHALRHSHVWLSYGTFLNHIFISPAQHQIHHSVAEKHWDKNMGSMFALWDWAFGTLYVPKEKEELVYGIPPEDQKEFRSLGNLYLQPFRNNTHSKFKLAIVLLLLGYFLYFAIENLVQMIL